MYFRYAIKNNSKTLNDASKDIDVIECNDLYYGWKNNDHHWTTKYVWNNFLPRLMKDLELDFKKDDFTEIVHHSSDGKYDLTYHIPKNDAIITFNDYIKHFSKTMKISELRASHDENLQCEGTILSTDYHRLFRGCHRVCEIINDEAVTNRNLILNCDSMSIPIIPILATYYKKILILDNRTRHSYRDKITPYLNGDSDLVELFIVDNWNNGKRKWNLQ